MQVTEADPSVPIQVHHVETKKELLSQRSRQESFQDVKKRLEIVLSFKVDKLAHDIRHLLPVSYLEVLFPCIFAKSSKFSRNFLKNFKKRFSVRSVVSLLVALVFFTFFNIMECGVLLSDKLCWGF